MVYFYAKLLTHCAQCDLESHLIYTIRTKMACRLYKIHNKELSAIVFDAACAAAKNVEDILQGRWTTIQNEEKDTADWDLEYFDLKRDTRLTLFQSRKYLQAALRPPMVVMAGDSFQLGNLNRICSNGFDEYATDRLAATLNT
jgi:hypothetical protein